MDAELAVPLTKLLELFKVASDALWAGDYLFAIEIYTSIAGDARADRFESFDEPRSALEATAALRAKQIVGRLESSMERSVLPHAFELGDVAIIITELDTRTFRARAYPRAMVDPAAWVEAISAWRSDERAVLTRGQDGPILLAGEPRIHIRFDDLQHVEIEAEWGKIGPSSADEILNTFSELLRAFRSMRRVVQEG